MAFEVPDLPYAYDALEPHIDEATMRVHHDKHHQAYVDKANAALEGTEWADRSVEDVLTNLSSLPGDKQGPVRNNAGGHYNHSLFWKMMSPDGGGEPTGAVGDAITEHLRLLRRLQGRVQSGRHRPLRLRLGLAGQRLLRPRGRLDPEPGHAALGRLLAAARRRRLGARLLPEVPEQTSRLPRRVLERRQLGLRQRAVRGGLGRRARQAAPPPPGGAARASSFGGRAAIACSARAVIVSDGLTPTLAGTAEPSQTSRFS